MCQIDNYFLNKVYLKMSYLNVSPRLKKDAAQLHKRFIDTCFTRLEAARQQFLEDEATTGLAPANISTGPVLQGDILV